MLLAALPAAELNRLYPPEQPLPSITPRTIVDPVAFRRELAETRRRGYATDYEESTPGLCCIAAPIYGSDETVVAAISVSVPTVRFTAERQNQLRLLVQQGADRLSRTLGHHTQTS
jgi:DNA-binding IclR family transcriptional regulator